MHKVIGEDYNQTGAMSLFREAGFRFSNSIFRDIYNTAKTNFGILDRLSNHSSDYMLSNNDAIKSLRHLTNDYLAVGSYEIYEPISDTNITQYISVTFSADFFTGDANDGLIGTVSDLKMWMLRALANVYGFSYDMIDNMTLNRVEYNQDLL